MVWYTYFMNMHEIHFEGKIAQKVIIEQDKKILLVQDPREKNDIWELPGGRMNIDEDPREAVQREFVEEMGVGINVGQVVHMEQFIQGNEGKRAFVIVYDAKLSDGEAVFDIDKREVSEVKWFSKEEVATLKLYPEYTRAIEVYFQNK